MLTVTRSPDHPIGRFVLRFVCAVDETGTRGLMKHNRNNRVLRPWVAGIAVAALSLGAAACSDDDGNEDDIDNPLDGVDDQIDDGAENVEEEIDSETDTTDTDG